MKTTIIITIIFSIVLVFISYFTYYYKNKSEMYEEAIESISKDYKDMEDKYTKLIEEKNEAKKKYDNLLTRIRNSSVRVSVPAKKCITSPATGEKRAELNPETVERILSVGRDGDEAIRELNYCIDRYNSIKDGK